MTASVALVGLALLDHVFAVERLPAAPGKHFATGHRAVVGGIAANAALAVARLGGRARLFGRVGDDAAGREVRAALAAGGVDCAGLATARGATPLSAVFVDATGERMLVNRKDPALFAAPPVIDIAGCGAVMADLRWPAATAAALSLARAAGAPAVLDYDQAPEAEARALLAGASHVVFGAEALAALTGLSDPAAGLAACAAPAFAAVTLGAGGVLWRGPDGAGGHVPAFAVPVVDTLGAGDAFHGACALALAEGADFPAALRFASAVAALKIGRPSGPDSLPTRPETLALLGEPA